MRKNITLVFTLVLIASGMIMAGNASAQSISKPATPEFTVELVEKVVDEPPKTTTNPYSGATVTQTEGSHYTYWIVDIKIKNTDPNAYYNYRIKGHFGTEWAVCPLIDHGDGIWTTKEYSPFDLTPHETFAKSSSSEYSEVQVKMYGLNSGDQVDVQVQAISGTIANASNGGYLILTGQGSDWSSIQTLTVPGDSTSVSPSPTVPEFSVWVILPLLVAVPLITTVLLRKKKT